MTKIAEIKARLDAGKGASLDGTLNLLCFAHADIALLLAKLERCKGALRSGVGYEPLANSLEPTKFSETLKEVFDDETK